MKEVLMDYSLLIGKIKNKYKTHDKFAEAMRMSKSGLSAKLNNRRDFSSEEIRKACELLSIPDADIPAIFFTQKVAI